MNRIIFGFTLLINLIIAAMFAIDQNIYWLLLVCTICLIQAILTIKFMD